jgi:hypothetical protein
MKPLNPPAGQKFDKNPLLKTMPPCHPPAVRAPAPRVRSLIVVFLMSSTGRCGLICPPGHQLAMPSTPLKRRIFPLISIATIRAAVPSPGRFAKH